MPESVIYIDGQYIKAKKTILDVFTPGHLRLRGVFETMRVVGPNIEFIDEHLDRLEKGLRKLTIAHGMTKAGLKHVARTVVRRNPKMVVGRMRIMVFSLGGRIHCVVMLLPYQLSSKLRRVKLVKTQREANAKFSDIKSLDYGLYAKAYQSAHDAGYDDALLLNNKGHVFETSRANVFIIYKGTCMTPPLSSGCLNGLVRQRLIKAAKEAKVPITERPITPQMVKSAARAFMSNSLMGLVPFKL